MSAIGVFAAILLTMFSVIGLAAAILFERSPSAKPPHPLPRRVAIPVFSIFGIVWIVGFVARIDVLTMLATAFMALVLLSLLASSYTWTRR